MRRPELLALLLWAATAVIATAAPPPADTGKPFDLGNFGGGNRKDPINITANTMEFDYKANILTYRGDVLAVQGDVKVKSDVMVITFAGKAAGDIKTEKGPKAKDATTTAAAPTTTTPPPTGAGANATPPTDTNPANKLTLQTVTCTGNVRIDQATRWATGGKAVFDQSKRTFVLSEKPFLHEGQNEVSGDRITVYLDENRSVVESSPAKRVQAVLYPDKGGGLVPTGPGGAKR